MDPIVNRPATTQPLAFAPAARPFTPGAGDMAPVKAPDVGIQNDVNRVDAGGLAGAAARANGEYVASPDVPTRSTPADPPISRDNFKQAASESLLMLNKLAGFFDETAAIDPASQPLFLRLGGLMEAVSDRLYKYDDPTTMGQDQLLGALRAVEEVRKKFADKDFKPDPSTQAGRREIDSLFTKLDSALVLPRGDAKPPTLQDNFRQGGMEALSVLNRLGGLFSDMLRLDASSQPLYLKLGGLINTISDRLYGYNRLGALQPASLTALLRTAQAIRDTLNDKDRIPKVDSLEGRDKIDGFVTTLANQIGLPFA